MRRNGLRWGRLAGAGALLVAVIGLAAAARTADAAEDGAAWLGVYTQDLTNQLREGIGYNGHGVLVNRVVDGSPAEKAGARKGDVMLRFNNRQIDDANDLTQLVRASRVGQRVAILVHRNGSRRTLNVTLGEAPAGATAPRVERWSSRDRVGDKDSKDGRHRVHIERHDGDDDDHGRHRVRIEQRGDGHNDGKADRKRIRIKKGGDGDHGVHEFHFEGDGKAPRVYRFDRNDFEQMAPEVMERLEGLKDLDLEGLGDMRLELLGNRGRGRLGVQIEDADDGARVTRVVEGSAAEKAGIREGDVITRFGGRVIDDAGDLMSAVQGSDEGSVDVTLKRDGRAQTVRPSLGEKTQRWSWSSDRTPEQRRELADRMRERAERMRDRADRTRERVQRDRGREVRDSERDVRREMEKLKEELRELERRLERMRDEE
jgi:membrane-associated protease RseP (regulator of RpoE activity)